MKAYLFEYKKIIKNNEAVNNINDEKYLQLVEKTIPIPTQQNKIGNHENTTEYSIYPPLSS